jgi:hypothetical protein
LTINILPSQIWVVIPQAITNLVWLQIYQGIGCQLTSTSLDFTFFIPSHIIPHLFGFLIKLPFIYGIDDSHPAHKHKRPLLPFPGCMSMKGVTFVLTIFSISYLHYSQLQLLM